MHIVIVIIVIIAIILLAIYSSWVARQRTLAMQQAAHSLGLTFYDHQDASMDERYPFLNKLCQGSNRYAYNIMSGTIRQHPVTAFDYHYETYSTDSKGKRRTSHHYFSFFILEFERSFPELLICQEAWYGPIAKFFGFDDINFESAEFSRRFNVSSPDKKFAYDICHPQMIEYLLANQDLNIEIEHRCLTLFFGSCLDPGQLPYNFERLIAIRDFFPNYLMNG
ncbi:MAG: hypothetical protein JNL67_02215 [Planctomycetaceae bacterium]|nr:hypothetical protein [Planctomycetaceae bacterium]